MRKVIKLTENELINLVKKIIREDEDQWVADSQEMEDETDFSKMEVPQEIANDRHFRRLVRFFENNPDLADELEQELERRKRDKNNVNEYGDDETHMIDAERPKNPDSDVREKEITESFWGRVKGNLHGHEYILREAFRK